MPDKPKGKKAPKRLKRRHFILIGAYVVVLIVAGINWALPSLNWPLSLGSEAPESN